MMCKMNANRAEGQMNIIKFILLMTMALVAEGFKSDSGVALNESAALSLKGQMIPSNGTGVVIFEDIGGYLGPEDGLLCTTNSSNFTVRTEWAYPNGTLIIQFPSINTFGIDTCHIEQGVSLYYSGHPKERGLFQCIISASNLSIFNVSVYIVDLNVRGPIIGWPYEDGEFEGLGSEVFTDSILSWPDEIIAAPGEDIALFVNVTVSPENVPLPYQWKLNGVNLPASNHEKYRGTQNNTLIIFDVRDEDQGNYTCSVAHSASGTRINSIKLRVLTVGTTVIGSTNNPQIGENYTLSCTVSGVDILKNSQPVYEYFWIKDGSIIRYFESTPFYTFDSLKFDDTGNYRCWGVVTFNRRIDFGIAGHFSPNFQLRFTVVTYRVYLYIQADCHQWMDTTPGTMTARRNGINNQLVQGINEECSEIQIKGDVIIMNNDHAFECPSKNPTKNAVVYSTWLHGNELANTSILVFCLDKWIKKSKYIVIDEFDVLINNNCSGVVNDYNSDFECGAPTAISHYHLPYLVPEEFITGLIRALCILLIFVAIALIIIIT